MRTNFDQIMSGQLTVSEMYDQMDTEMLQGGAGISGKKEQSMMKVVKGSGGAFAGEDIESEFKIADDEFNQ